MSDGQRSCQYVSQVAVGQTHVWSRYTVVRINVQYCHKLYSVLVITLYEILLNNGYMYIEGRDLKDTNQKKNRLILVKLYHLEGSVRKI